MLNKLLIKSCNLLPNNIQEIWLRIVRSDIGNRIANGAFWSILGSVISRALVLFASIILARILGKTEYGQFGIIRSTVNMFSVFGGFGLGITATKFVAQYREKDPKKVGRVIGLTILFAVITGAIITLVLLIGAPYLATKTINSPALLNDIRLSALMLFFSAINGAQTGALVGFESFKTIAKVNILAGVAGFPIQILFARWYGLDGAVVGFGLSFMIQWFINYFTVRKVAKRFGVTIVFKGAWVESRLLYKFSLPALLSGVLVGPVMWASSTFLVNRPGGYAEMAIFDVANQWRNAILFIPIVISQIVLPLLATSENKEMDFMRILKYNVIVNFIVSLGMVLTVALASTYIMSLYGKGFLEGKLVLIIVTLTTILISVNNVVGQAITAKSKMWSGFILNLLWAITMLLSSYYLITNNFGALGLAYSLLISYVIHTALTFIYVRRFLGLSKLNK